MHIVNTLAPVFLVIALGAALRHGNVISSELQRGMIKLAYWIGLPCLLVAKIASSRAVAGEAGMMIAVFLSATAAMILLAAVAAKLLGLRAGQVGTFIQAAFRGNLAFIGLPVVFFAFADGAGAGAEAQAIAALSLGPIIVIYNIAAVVVLLASEHRLTKASLRKITVGIVTNPLIIACGVGVGLVLLRSQFNIALPTFAMRTLGVVGQFALPVALLSVGGAIASTPIRGQLRLATLASAIKLVAGPALGYLAAWVWGAEGDVRAITLIMLACPTAVSSYILVTQLKGDESLAAGSVVLTTLLSAAALAGVIALTT